MRHDADNRLKLSWVQTALHLIYPARCTICGTQVDSDFALCGPCWRDTPLISGFCCDTCGTPLPGEGHGEAEYCDDCLRIARPWAQGRAAILYRDNGRKLVLDLKHGDKHEVLKPCARWMANAVRPILNKQRFLIAPIPLHRLRLFRRRYNQSALLVQSLNKLIEQETCLDLLLRQRRTKSLDGLDRNQRFAELDRAITVNPKWAERIEGRDVLIVDDVMTSGATLSSAAQACLAAGAAQVCVLVLARVVKDP